jgi:tRNA-specific 2-thiouridylase
MAKVLVGLSGGVDSSVAAALLLQQGHEVSGAYMKNWINEENIAGHCPWEEDIRDARAVAEKLGIEFKVVNLMRDYRERVVDYLLRGYTDGVTPNPDVLCNREMKFGVFLDHAKAEGFDYVATGHYARVRDNADGSRDILRGIDPNKDQTYFLALLQPHQVRHALFPIGHLTKSEVRAAAAQFGLPTASKKDSQGICFIGEVKMSDFLRHHVADQPGEIVTVDGRKVGTHRGLHLYTLGQRKGIGVPSNTENKAFVVVEKRGATRELVVGFDEFETPGLYANETLVTNLSFCNRPLTTAVQIEAAPRYRSRAVRIHFRPQRDDPSRAQVHWLEPQRALTPGQICAFYEGEVLLGGGVFAEVGNSAGGGRE